MPVFAFGLVRWSRVFDKPCFRKTPSKPPHGGLENQWFKFCKLRLVEGGRVPKWKVEYVLQDFDMIKRRYKTELLGRTAVHASLMETIIGCSPILGFRGELMTDSGRHYPFMDTIRERINYTTICKLFPECRNMGYDVSLDYVKDRME